MARSITLIPPVPSLTRLSGSSVSRVRTFIQGGVLKGDVKDVLLLERDELTSGSTWHAAGLLPLFNMSYSVGKVHQYSLDLYSKLEEEPGHGPVAAARSVGGRVSRCAWTSSIVMLAPPTRAAVSRK